jgi:DNA-binding NarL/FixJ family response regulator
MNGNEPTRLLLADDDDPVRDELAMALQQSGEFLVAAAVRNGAEALEALSQDLPDLALLDIRMPDVDGLQCCRKIKERYPELPVLMLTTFQDDTYLAEALEAGAHGYLLKHQSAEAVMHGIRNALSGNVSFEPGVARSLGVIDTARDEAFLEGLPPRAIDVLRSLARGSSNREIAEQLFLSEGTVRNYVSNLLQFADVRDRTPLVIWFYRSGSFNP